jgi:hypothetical protein
LLACIGAVLEVRQTELGSTYLLYVPGGRLNMGAESVVHFEHLMSNADLKSIPPSFPAKALDEVSSPFKFVVKYEDLTRTTYIEDEFFVFLHNVSQRNQTKIKAHRSRFFTKQSRFRAQPKWCNSYHKTSKDYQNLTRAWYFC